jgi:hypothetical protein
LLFVSSGRRVVVGFIVVTLVFLFLSSLSVHGGGVDGTTLVDRHTKDTHRKVQQRVYFLFRLGSGCNIQFDLKLCERWGAGAAAPPLQNPFLVWWLPAKPASHHTRKGTASNED